MLKNGDKPVATAMVDDKNEVKHGKTTLSQQVTAMANEGVPAERGSRPRRSYGHNVTEDSNEAFPGDG